MLDEECLYLDKKLGGRREDPSYFQNFPCQPIPKFLDDFYVFRMSMHFFELVRTVIFDRQRSDFYEYFLHHLLTETLIFFSYSLNLLPVGASIMLLHDLTDLSVSLFKLTCDNTPPHVHLFFYFVMLFSWLYIRIWYFPFHVITRIIHDIKNWHYDPYDDGIAFMFVVFLIALTCMHVFWLKIMI